MRKHPDPRRQLHVKISNSREDGYPTLREMGDVQKKLQELSDDYQKLQGGEKMCEKEDRASADL
jgi:hypothetical protein